MLISTSCIKEAGKVIPVDVDGGTSGSTTGGVEPGEPDPLAAHAWHLGNTAQNSFSTGVGIAGEDISITEAVAEGFTGEGIKIAVSDSGTDIDHEDLTENQLVGQHRNYANSQPAQWRITLPYVVGNDAHGTAVAGLIAAEGWNGVGSRGVAPDAKYAAFRFVGEYTYTTASMLLRNIDQADGDFDIFNYSYGYGQCYFVTEDEIQIEAFEDGVANLRNGKGALYVQSSGNDYINYQGNCLDDSSLNEFAGNTNSSDDLALPEKIIVSAVNAIGLRSSYSTPGSGIWVSAPGGEYGSTSPAMITTDIAGCNNGYSRISSSLNAFNRGSSYNRQCSYTNTMNGTSSAAPVLSGVIALMLQANPALTWRDVKHILALTSDEVDYSLTDELFHPWGTGNDLFGHVYDWKWIRNGALPIGIDYSNWYGFGRVNALNAVIMANTYTFPLGAYERTMHPRNESWYYDSGIISEAIPDASALGTDINSSTRLNVLHNFIIESVQIEFNATHAAPKDLGISLISPLGTESRLLLINNGLYGVAIPEDKLLMTNAFYGERSLGTWTIRVVDGQSPNSGTLTNWKLRINGHRMTGDGTFPVSPTGLILPASYPSSNLTPPVTFTHSVSVDVVRYEVSVGTSSGLTDIATWTSVGMDNTDVQMSGLTLVDGNNYYVNIRAIDNQENASSVASAVWNANY